MCCYVACHLLFVYYGVPHRFKHLQLTATRSSRYEPLKAQKLLSLYLPRIVIPISQLGGLSVNQLAYGELDTVGIVVCTTSSHVAPRDPEGAEQQVDNVYIADCEGCLMVVRVWDGLKVCCSLLKKCLGKHMRAQCPNLLMLL